MKKFYKIIPALIAIVALTGSVHAQIKITQSEYVREVAPMTLRTVGGDVEVAFDMEIGKKFIRPDQACVITPMFIRGPYTQELPPVVLKGRNYAIVSREKNFFDGSVLPVDMPEGQSVTYNNNVTAIHYQEMVPFNSNLRGAKLVLNYKTYNNCGTPVSENVIALADGVTDYSDFRYQDPIVYYYPNRVDKRYVNDFSNRSMFRINRKVIDMDNFVRYGYADFEREIKKLQADTDVQLVKIMVNTSASPEGPLKHNRELAEARANVIADYIVKKLDLPASLITKQWVDENWEAFEQDLASSSLNNKAEIRTIISQTGDLDERENKLRKLNNWKTIYDMFQNLRNCHIVVDYTTREYYPDEIEINGRNMAIVEIGGDKVLSLEKTTGYYKADPVSIANLNNMMVALTAAGKFEEAETYADRIPNRGIEPLVANNKGVLYMYLKESQLAETMFELAGNIPMADYNKGLMYLYSEKYDSAADLLNRFDVVNSMAANLDAGRNRDASRNTYMNLPAADIYYLRAISYANDGLEDLALNALADAVGQDASYRTRALNQAEFVSYKNNADFIAITGANGSEYVRERIVSRSDARAAIQQDRLDKRADKKVARDAKRLARKNGTLKADRVKPVNSDKAVAKAEKAAQAEQAKADKAAAKAARDAGKAAAKAANDTSADKEVAKAEKAAQAEVAKADKAAAKAERDAEKATAKAGKDADKAAAKAADNAGAATAAADKEAAKAMKAAQSEQAKAEKAAAKAGKDADKAAEKAAKEADKAAKDIDKTASKVDKAAEKNARNAEKAAVKAAKQAEKAAAKAAKEAEKAAKMAESN